MRSVQPLGMRGRNPLVLATMLAVLAFIPDLAAQCLEVRVLDPAGSPLAGAVVAAGGMSVPADSRWDCVRSADLAPDRTPWWLRPLGSIARN